MDIGSGSETGIKRFANRIEITNRVRYPHRLLTTHPPLFLPTSAKMAQQKNTNDLQPSTWSCIAWQFMHRSIWCRISQCTMGKTRSFIVCAYTCTSKLTPSPMCRHGGVGTILVWHCIQLSLFDGIHFDRTCMKLMGSYRTSVLEDDWNATMFDFVAWHNRVRVHHNQWSWNDTSDSASPTHH